MNDAELLRLRRLRECAQRSRVIARAMAANRHAWNHPLLMSGVSTCWRIVRAVSGKLKAHPDLRCQADIGVAERWHHGVLAAFQLFKGGARSQVLREYLALMRQLSRQLDDARALTLSADLSDTFGRAQVEINTLIFGLAREAGAVHAVCLRGPACPVRADAVNAPAAPFDGEWPYLSLGPRQSSRPPCPLRGLSPLCPPQ